MRTRATPLPPTEGDPPRARAGRKEADAAKGGRMTRSRCRRKNDGRRSDAKDPVKRLPVLNERKSTEHDIQVMVECAHTRVAVGFKQRRTMRQGGYEQ